MGISQLLGGARARAATPSLRLCLDRVLSSYRNLQISKANLKSQDNLSQLSAYTEVIAESASKRLEGALDKYPFPLHYIAVRRSSSMAMPITATVTLELVITLEASVTITLLP